jgi:hypothetical protein
MQKYEKKSSACSPGSIRGWVRADFRQAYRGGKTGAIGNIVA